MRHKSKRFPREFLRRASFAFELKEKNILCWHFFLSFSILYKWIQFSSVLSFSLPLLPIQLKQRNSKQLSSFIFCLHFSSVSSIHSNVLGLSNFFRLLPRFFFFCLPCLLCHWNLTVKPLNALQHTPPNITWRIFLLWALTYSELCKFLWTFFLCFSFWNAFVCCSNVCIYTSEHGSGGWEMWGGELWSSASEENPSEKNFKNTLDISSKLAFFYF